MTRAIHVALGSIFLGAFPAAADAIRTDANIITAIDISDSMQPREIKLEIDGMAQAIRSRAVLQAIQAGPEGRVGFAVFAWYDKRTFPELVSWTLIASEADALRVSDQLAQGLRLVDDAEKRRISRVRAARLTDTSEAIEHAADLFRMAPYVTSRPVVNIIGNGEDNVVAGPRRARDALMAEGGTINGVVLGGDPAVLDYFREQVVGGPGAFLLSIDETGSVVQQLVRKLRYDIAAYADPMRAVTPIAEHEYPSAAQLAARWETAGRFID